MSLLVYSDFGKTQLVCPKGALSRVCTVPAGASFSVDVKTGPAPASGFQGYQIVLQYRGLSFVDQVGLGENRWPPCRNTGFDQNTPPTLTQPGRYTLGCKGGPPPRTFKGVLANVHFGCGEGSGGQIDIIGGGGAFVSFYDRPSINGNRIFLFADPKNGKNVADAVTIRCGSLRVGPAGERADACFDPTGDGLHRIDDVFAAVLGGDAREIKLTRSLYFRGCR